MNKLLKLSETHYIVVIVVDDSEIKLSEIKLNDWVYSMDGVHQWFGLVLTTEPLPKKITHSTEPLEYKYGSQKHGFNMGVMSSDIKLVYDQIKPLDLSEVEEAIYGYSVEKMIPTKFCIPHKHYISKDDKICYDTGFKDGFKAHQELVKDKLFTVEKAIQILEEESFGQGAVSRDEYKARVISKLQSLLPKTEWDIEITPEGKIILL